MKMMRAVIITLCVLCWNGCGGALGGLLIGAGIGGAAGLVAPVPPAVETTPSSLDFRRVARGEQKDLQITIRGRQNEEVVKIFSISVSGNAFSLVGAPSVPLTIRPKGDLQITVRFQPSSKGKNTGKLEIRSFVAGDAIRVLVVSLEGSGT